MKEPAARGREEQGATETTRYRRGTVDDDHEVPVLSERDLLAVLLRAWDGAIGRFAGGATAGALHADRSKNFVGALGDVLAAHYEKFPDVRVFCHGRQQEEFARREEFLFDVLVARIDRVTSPVHRASLPIICAPLLQVESELKPDTRETLVDASKIVCGAAPQSLVVVPVTPRPSHYLDPLADIARHVRGEVFVAFVPHPKRWGATAPAPALYRWATNGWLRVGG